MQQHARLPLWFLIANMALVAAAFAFGNLLGRRRIAGQHVLIGSDADPDQADAPICDEVADKIKAMNPEALAKTFLAAKRSLESRHEGFDPQVDDGVAQVIQRNTEFLQAAVRKGLTVREVLRSLGTFPVTKLPRDDRVLNPYRLYQRWLAGGRALLLPLFLLLGAGRRVRDFFRWLGRCVRELKGPSVAVDMEAAEGADFQTALRKIGRARGPLDLVHGPWVSRCPSLSRFTSR